MNLEKLKCKSQYILPHHLLSRLIAQLANCEVPFIKDKLIKLFIHHYQIDMSIAESTNLQDYANFNQFFTRNLKKTARPIVNEEWAVVSPADGTVSQAGQINAGRLLQAKGEDFELIKLLGGDNELAHTFQAGSFLTIYLAPKDYHRVHLPIAGKLLKTIYIPGKLFSVNHLSVKHIANLFCNNERLVCLFETSKGIMALILVGAMLVAGIETVWAGRVTPCYEQRTTIKDYHSEQHWFEKGAEIGRFQFGSTVIVLFPPDMITLQVLESGQSIQMGQLIGRLND